MMQRGVVSPRPWQYDEFGMSAIRDACDNAVGSIFRSVDVVHAVRCVNAHDELVKIVKALVSRLGPGIDEEADGFMAPCQVCWSPYEALHEDGCPLKTAEQLLAKHEDTSGQ